LQDYITNDKNKINNKGKLGGNMKVLKKNNSAINILTEPFNITIDLMNNGTLKF